MNIFDPRFDAADLVRDHIDKSFGVKGVDSSTMQLLATHDDQLVGVLLGTENDFDWTPWEYETGWTDYAAVDMLVSVKRGVGRQLVAEAERRWFLGGYDRVYAVSWDNLTRRRSKETFLSIGWKVLEGPIKVWKGNSCISCGDSCSCEGWLMGKSLR